MKWFLEQANGGDVLILRTSGSDGYNQYFYSQLGISVNSVESIVFNNFHQSKLYTLKNITSKRLWFGRRQWNYISYWRDTPIDSLIRHVLSTRNIVIGGTSRYGHFGRILFYQKMGQLFHLQH